MISAADIAAALGEARPDGRDVRTKCPRCGGPLALRDTKRGLMAKCWAGCDSTDVYRELRRRKLLTGKRPVPLSPEEAAAANVAAEHRARVNVARARDLWEQGQPIRGTAGDRYLRAGRGLDILSPYIGADAEHALRFCSRCWHSPGIYRPAVLARIDHYARGFIGVHVTFLAPDGYGTDEFYPGKAALDPVRKVIGACKGGAARLGTPSPSEWLIVGEGLETTLSVMQACALPGWAALSADGICSVELPPDARMVVIAADHDKSGVGASAARRAAARLIGEGRRARIYLPPRAGSDWNDVLLGKAPADAEG
ncbi:MAG: DUF7146 domain-containing protein [Stellaceae bacterium]